MSINSLSKFPEENPNPVMRLSHQGKLLYCNKASRPLLYCWGHLSNEFIDGPALDILKNAVAGHEPVTHDFECGDRVFMTAFVPINGMNYVNVYALDITEKKDAEKALQIALEEVRRLRNRLQRENRYLREEIRAEVGFDRIIGESSAQAGVMHKILQVAVTDATVLITGETGTGKELIARAVHAKSRRRALPLIKINCAALPTELIESELFGHQKGAFTGAVSNKVGRFELANGGTLFLDEIGDLPTEAQSKLLRALQEQEFERVGGTRTIQVDVRVIAATNRELTEQIGRGKFREDLFYRLNVFPIHSLPLRERREDIPNLAYHFLRKFTKKTGKSIEGIDDPVMTRLLNYRWPGNVRELENIIERAVILCDGPVLQLDEAFEVNAPSSRSDIRTLGQVEQEMIQQALELSNWKIEGKHGAAIRLAIAPSTLRERIKKYGLSRFRSESREISDPHRKN